MRSLTLVGVLMVSGCAGTGGSGTSTGPCANHDADGEMLSASERGINPTVDCPIGGLSATDCQTLIASQSTAEASAAVYDDQDAHTSCASPAVLTTALGDYCRYRAVVRRLLPLQRYPPDPVNHPCPTGDGGM